GGLPVGGPLGGLGAGLPTSLLGGAGVLPAIGSANSGGPLPGTANYAALAAAIGDAKIAYAANLGNASIALAQIKGAAAVTYQSSLLTAAQDGDTSDLDLARIDLLVQPKIQYAIGVASAHLNRAINGTTAERNR